MGDETHVIQIGGDRHDNVNNEIVPHNPRDPRNAHNGKQIFMRLK
jgi:hypothetical protein